MKRGEMSWGNQREEEGVRMGEQGNNRIGERRELLGNESREASR